MMVYPYNGISYGNENKQDIITGNNISEPDDHNFE